MKSYGEAVRFEAAAICDTEPRQRKLRVLAPHSPLAFRKTEKRATPGDAVGRPVRFGVSLNTSKPVLVHTCFNPEVQKTAPAAGCSCKKRVTFRERDTGVSTGRFRYVMYVAGNKKEYPDGRQVVEARKETRTPRTPTIEKAHIERAYITGDPETREREQGRIEAYGILTEESLGKLGAGLRQRGTQSPALPGEIWRETAGESVLRLEAAT